MKKNLTRDELEAFWMPYTGNRHFKADPRLIVGAEGTQLIDADGRRLFDGLSGLWCTPFGHGRTEIADAVSRQIRELDYAPPFQFGHPLAFELANRLKGMTPGGLDYSFLVNSGSEAADTSLKMARAYWRLKGQPEKTKFIGRARSYHGVNLGGTSLGGIGPNRKLFGQLVDADHLPHTVLPENAFSRGEPETGVELADALEDMVVLHDASNIAALIVEPMAGSAGVLPPPKGYLQRLRALCDRHDILLIFDEVITGFGRLGEPFAADYFGVKPDIMNLAKVLTNGCVPMGAVIADERIYQTFMDNGGPDYAIEFPHGYTYSAHPLACAAALASIDVFERDDMAGRVRALAGHFEDEAPWTQTDAPRGGHSQSGPCWSYSAGELPGRTRSQTFRGRHEALGERAFMCVVAAIHCSSHRPYISTPGRDRQVVRTDRRGSVRGRVRRIVCG